MYEWFIRRKLCVQVLKLEILSSIIIIIVFYCLPEWGELWKKWKRKFEDAEFVNVYHLKH